jgi:hypothetical protein
MDEEVVCLITIKFIFKRRRIKNESKQKYCKNERGLVVSSLFAEGAVPSYRRGARYRAMAGSHPSVHPSGEVLGANGRSGRLHADRLFGSVSPGPVVSAADATFASVGIGVEVDLADRRCTPTVVSRSNGRINLGDGLSLLDSRDCSFRHSLALCVCTLREEARGSVALREAVQRSSRLPLISRMCIGKEAPSLLSGRIGLCFSQFY